MNISHQDIYDKIALANNGKMLLANFSAEEKAVINEMRSLNLVAPANFMSYGDAVKIHYLNPAYKK